MRLLRTKVWSCILLGMVAGIYLADVLRPYEMVLLVLAILCALKPAVDYFRE